MKSSQMLNSIVFVDTEVSAEGEVLDYGAVNAYEELHTASAAKFERFLHGRTYICGHNLITHDMKYIANAAASAGADTVIDTLYLAPLLFPGQVSYRLPKDDKPQEDALNNPLNDAKKAKWLFEKEVDTFVNLPEEIRRIYVGLLSERPEFSGFFRYLGCTRTEDVSALIQDCFRGRICANCNLTFMAADTPIELAYSLALIQLGGQYAVIPDWVHIQFPAVETVMRLLRNTQCKAGCAYCNKTFAVRRRLKDIFGYDSFRKYNGEPLQENAVRAAVRGESLLAVFPTGGGKSLTFQLPALIAGEASHGLTVVISPLQSLMKDQVDNLEKRGITNAVTINGLLSPLERADAIERVLSGRASILYISPESLRSQTIERLFLSRTVERFVIDEAHCFSAWGQDFRVDYLYIGDFIRELQEKKQSGHAIPVSCFTATARKRVICDIRDYFQEKLGLTLRLYTSTASRTNLQYKVVYKTDEEKYPALRELIEQHDCPVIVYVSRVKRTREIANKLCRDGFQAREFNGRLDSASKQANQDAFLRGEAQIIVATSAFGMGVDKPDVGLVVHYDIADSLENYVQEAGRAGRDPSLSAECIVLFNNEDLDKHFRLLNQSKLSLIEIRQIWKAVKTLTRNRPVLCRSPLEIARTAGWDDTVFDIETRVKAAVQALENAGYIKRGRNMPHVYATSILVSSMTEASAVIDRSPRIPDDCKELSRRILQQLISGRSIAQAGNADADTRVDYISDRLGAEKAAVLRCIDLLRGEGILADSRDLTAYIHKSDTENKSMAVLRKYTTLEEFLLDCFDSTEQDGFLEEFDQRLKELNQKAREKGIRSSTVARIKTIRHYWTIKGYIEKSADETDNRLHIRLRIDAETLKQKRQQCMLLAQVIVTFLYARSREMSESVAGAAPDEVLVSFSVLELKTACERDCGVSVQTEDIEDALLYLSKIDALKLEGGFLVLYNAMEITRLERDNRIQYKKDDYAQLAEFYAQRRKQIHFVGEYANLMARDANAALRFVDDYFTMENQRFENRYFPGSRKAEISRNITPAFYEQLVNGLSDPQKAIFHDDESQYIVVAAGPGSGKTRVLVHKLASLIQLEDVKHEQLLMLTFARAAATEFSIRLRELIGNAATFVGIKTFHSYCFDLLGRPGSLEDADSIIRDAARMIRDGEVEPEKITKSVIVIDEAQDMNGDEFALLEALMEYNETMRVIAVGDDDQNIYQFHNADAACLRSLINDRGATRYELLENFRSCRNVVALANAFAATIPDRMKSNPILAADSKAGDVRLVRHTGGGHFETAVVNDLLQSYDSAGRTCVLTSTNEQALSVLYLLRKNGITARQIQGRGVKPYDIAEIRYCFKKIREELENSGSTIINEDCWNNALRKLREQYASSTCLPFCLQVFDTYAHSVERKYPYDLEMFLRESRLEDFCPAENGTVFVSTIHSAKGREFDSVYMLLDSVFARANTPGDKAQLPRMVYVGMTRAKSLLHIHYNEPVLDSLIADCAERLTDSTTYAEPEEFVIQLGLGDVFLDFFKDKERKRLIFRLRSGMELLVDNCGLNARINGKVCEILKFSAKINQKRRDYAQKGYALAKATVRFIVAWKGRNDPFESAVVLPDLYFRKVHAASDSVSCAN